MRCCNEDRTTVEAMYIVKRRAFVPSKHAGRTMKMGPWATIDSYYLPKVAKRRYQNLVVRCSGSYEYAIFYRGKRVE